MLFCALWKAFWGRRLWNSIAKKIAPDSAVLFCFGDERNIAKHLLAHLDVYLEKSDFRTAYIVTDYAELVDFGRQCTSRIQGAKVTSTHAMMNFLQFYCLYQVDRRILIGSMTRPNGRHADRVLGINGVDEKDISLIGVYAMKQLPDEPDERLP